MTHPTGTPRRTPTPRRTRSSLARARRRLELVLHRRGRVPRRRVPGQDPHAALTAPAVTAASQETGFLSFGAGHPGGGLTHTGGEALHQTVELAVAAPAPRRHRRQDEPDRDRDRRDRHAA